MVTSIARPITPPPLNHPPANDQLLSGKSRMVSAIVKPLNIELPPRPNRASIGETSSSSPGKSSQAST